MKFKRLLYVTCIILCFTLILPISISNATVDTSSVTVNAPVALLMNSNTGKVVYDKNIHEKMFPASTTKIMTAILALENCNLTDVATVSYNAIFSVPSGYTNANLQVGEELTIEQLLNILLIPSANDAANVIAEHVAGSVESFATMMNTKAYELGCENTHFVNANGVHDDNHYSTAYDLAIICKYAMQNETFRNIVSKTKYTLPSTNKYGKTDRVFTTTNKLLLNSKSGQYYEYATGAKTGYTSTAKNCIVATAKKDDLEWICVVLGASTDNDTDTNKFADCISLFNFGFDNYSYKKLVSKDEVYKVISPRNANRNSKELNVLYDSDLYALVDNTETDEFIPEVELDTKMKAPISKGSVIGKVSYSIYDINYTTNLIAGQDIEEISIFTIIMRILIVVIILILLKKFLTYITKGNKRKSKKKKKKKKNKSNYISPYTFNFK